MNQPPSDFPEDRSDDDAPPETAMNRIGKFEALKIVNEFDRTLIEMFGINMTDARITRYEALAAIAEAGSVRKAAESFGQRRGIPALDAPA